MGAGNVEEFSHFCELPHDFTEEILAWLPVDYLCKFSSVCKKWKILFSSTRFITTQWAEAPPNKNPVLLIGAVDYYRECDCFAYSSFTQSWKSCPLSLPFMDPREGTASRNPSLFLYIASGAGLILVGSTFIGSIYVCNPFTGKYFILSHLTFRKHYLNGELGIVQEGENGYKVVAVHTPRTLRQQIVEIYESRDKVWMTAGAFRENLTLHSSVTERDGLVFSALGFFYSLARSDGVEGIVSFNMLEGNYLFVPMPPATEYHIVLFNYLVSCASRILLVAEMNSEIELDGDRRVVIWEYIDDAEPTWQLIATMPPTTFRQRLRARALMTLVHCAGMGDCIYFRVEGVGWKQVTVYNLTQNSWSVVRNCSFSRAEIFDSPPFFGFTPRLDMKVD